MIREIRFGVGPITRWRRGHRGVSMLIRDHFPAGASGQQLAPSTIMAVPAAPRRADPRANATASGTGASQVLPTQALTLTLSGAAYPELTAPA